MALTADYEYSTRSKTDINEVKAGAADTLYKGAILNAGTNGFAKVAADVASEVPLGVCVEQVVAAGSNAEVVKIESGVFKLKKVTQHKFTVTVTDDTAADNAKFNGEYFVIYDGTTGYYVWFKVTNGGAGPDPAPSGLTGIEVDIIKASTAAQIAALIETALEAAGLGGGATFNVTTAAAVCTVVVQRRSFSDTVGDGTAGAVIATVNTVMSGAQQSDIGTLFFAKADDGVIYSSEKSNISAPVGLCVGVDEVNGDYLWIDTRIRGV
jgi:hypothetical protein